MKTFFHLLFLSVISVTLSACGIQKTASESVENEASAVYRRPEIVEAVKNSRFKIEMTDLITSDGKYKNAFGSYAVLNGDTLEMYYARQVDFKRQQMGNVNLVYGDSQIDNFSIQKKNMIFTIAGMVESPAYPPKANNNIFLYISARTDSDICIVDISYDRGGSSYYRFRGRIIPL